MNPESPPDCIASGTVLPLRPRDGGRAKGQGYREPTADDNAEFCLILAPDRDVSPAIRIVDAHDGRLLTGWSGRVAATLLESSELRIRLAGGRRCDCPKGLLKRLMLAASAATSLLEQADEKVSAIVDGSAVSASSKSGAGHSEQHGGAGTLARRLAEVSVSLPLDCLSVARELFRHPGEHFTATDVQTLLAMSYPLSDTSRVAGDLETLARHRIIQRIEVAPTLVFFDIDVTPHAHRYDPTTGELYDA